MGRESGRRKQAMRMIIVAGFLTAALLMAAIGAVSVDRPAWTSGGKAAAAHMAPAASRVSPTAG
jgi:hypothetical protein